MPTMKHECGKRYTQVHDAYGKFRGLFCTLCSRWAPKQGMRR